MEFLFVDTSSTTQRYVAVPNHMLDRESTACIYGVWAFDNERVEWILNSANKVIGYNLKYTPLQPADSYHESHKNYYTTRQTTG